MSIKNDNLTKRYDRIRNRAYFRLGAQKLIQKPYLNIIPLIIILFSVFLWNVKGAFLALLSPPKLLTNIVTYCITIIFVIIPLLLFLAFVEFTGKLTARPIENNLDKLFDTDKPYPILLSHKKHRSIVQVEFYSDRITLRDWNNPEAFEKTFRGQLISVKLGPKYKTHSSHFIVKYSETLEQTDRGDLTDAPFPINSGI